MSTSDSRQTENLVAYLDGELNDDDASRVEETLTEQALIRQEVEKLTRVWELLDLLPEGKASATFTERTLFAVQTQLGKGEGEDADTRPIDTMRSSHWKRRLRRIALRTAAFLGLLIVASAGFNGAFRRDTAPMDQLLNDLPVIERLDQYREVGDLEFLKALNNSGLLNGNASADNSTSE
ncbi:hypothetical protein GC176_27500 [bacterium]|nr:hypothetical protein [bacterium]